LTKASPSFSCSLPNKKDSIFFYFFISFYRKVAANKQKKHNRNYSAFFNFQPKLNTLSNRDKHKNSNHFLLNLLVICNLYYKNDPGIKTKRDKQNPKRNYKKMKVLYHYNQPSRYPPNGWVFSKMNSVFRKNTNDHDFYNNDLFSLKKSKLIYLFTDYQTNYDNNFN